MISILANYERRSFDKGLHIWIEKYRGLRNIPHWHFESELIVCLAGTANIMLEGFFHELRPDFCAYCGSEIIHSIAGSEDSLLLVVQFEAFDAQGLPNYRLKNPVFRDRYQIRDRMELIYREYRAKRPFYAEMVNAVMTQLNVDILRGEEIVERRAVEPVSLLRYKELLAEIDQHCETLSFSAAARFMNMSEAYFSRFFKRVSGLTFSQYLNVVRVSRAVDLLGDDPDLPVRELLAETGFNTIRNFNRVFKSVTGFSPKQLPDNYILPIRSLTTRAEFFDPTLESSEILSAGAE